MVQSRILFTCFLGVRALFVHAWSADTYEEIIKKNDDNKCTIFITKDLLDQQGRISKIFGELKIDPLDVTDRIVNVMRLNEDDQLIKPGPLVENRSPPSLRVFLSGSDSGHFNEIGISRAEAREEVMKFMAKYCPYEAPFSLAISDSESKTTTMEKYDKQTLALKEKTIVGYTFTFRLSLGDLPVFNGYHTVDRASDGIRFLSYMALHVRELDQQKITPLTIKACLSAYALQKDGQGKGPDLIYVGAAELGYLISGERWITESPRIRPSWKAACSDGTKANSKHFTIYIAADNGEYLCAEGL